MKKLVTAILLSGSLGSALAGTWSFGEGNWSLGGGALVSANPYRDTKTNILPIPFISYQGQYAVLYGPIAKLRYRFDKNQTVGLRFQLGMQEFDPSDADTAPMSQLDERQRLLFAGPYYRFNNEYGQITAGAVYDVSGRSSGATNLQVRYAYPYSALGRRVYVRPGLGLSWFNKAFGEHYYGVSSEESARSGLNEYHGKSFFEPFASLFAGIKLFKKVYWTNVANFNYLTNPVKDSPMVNKRFTYTLITGITYEIGEAKQRFNH